MFRLARLLGSNCDRALTSIREMQSESCRAMQWLPAVPAHGLCCCGLRSMNFASVDRIYPAWQPAARPVLRPSYGDSSQSSFASITNLAESPRKSTHIRFVNLVVGTADGSTGFLSYCWKLRWASGKLSGVHRMCGAGNASSTRACGYWVRSSSPSPLTLYLCVRCASSPSRYHPQGSLKSHHSRPFRITPHFLLSRRHHPLLCRLVDAGACYHDLVVALTNFEGLEHTCRRWTCGEACISYGNINLTERYVIRSRLRTPFFNSMLRGVSSTLAWSGEQT